MQQWYYDMMLESRNSSLLDNGLVNIFPWKRTHATVEERCFLWRISAAVNQYATIQEAVFSLGAAPRLYKEDLKKLKLELRESPELAVGRIIEK
jgi:hypothetical protein